MTDKEKIINLFNKNLKGIDICLKSYNNKHSGKEGHFIEKKMEIKHNSKNEPDLYGYEMKKYSNKRNIINNFNNWNDDIKLNRNEFIKIFGNPNPNKNNRYSWSGYCVPKYNIYNSNGQIIKIENNDLIIYYSYSYDKRDNKENIPDFLKKDNIMIVIWKAEKLEKYINNKFNVKGFFTLKKIDNKYEKICFGKPFNFEFFIENFKNKKIIFDSGMYEGNSRNYSHFRGMNLLDDLIIEEY